MLRRIFRRGGKGVTAGVPLAPTALAEKKHLTIKTIGNQCQHSSSYYSKLTLFVAGGAIRTSSVARLAEANSTAMTTTTTSTTATVTPRRAFHNSSVRRSNDNDKYAKEDKEELERERALREKFARKIDEHLKSQQQSQQTSNSSGSSNTSGGQSSSSSSSGTTAPGAGSFSSGRHSTFVKVLFLLSSIYMIILLNQLEDPNSPLMILQGIPWWQLPSDTVAYYLLFRSLVSYRQQSNITREFGDAQKSMPMMSLPYFFQLKYPALFDGYNTRQNEVVAALSACFALQHNYQFAQLVSNAAGASRDTKAAVDGIMTALVREYPTVFAPAPQQPQQPQPQPQ